MDNQEYIATYFEGAPSGEDKKIFEEKILRDAGFAEEVAFYLSARQAAATGLKKERDRFREIYEQYKTSVHATNPQPAPVRKLWPRIAAAAVLAGVVFGLYTWFKPASPAVLAGNYIKENFQTLPVKMSAAGDSLETALRLYNEGNSLQALHYLETLAARDSSLTEAIKYAGIVSLQMEQYDKAIHYFSRLENHSLYINPGKFYHALALLKRNRTGDKQNARILLEQVVQNDLAGKEAAQDWLKKW